MSLKLENISFSRNNTKLFDNFNYTFPSNSITPIVGASGCGKTTLINIAAGILHPEAGKVILDKDGKDMLITKPSKEIMVMNQTYTNFSWVSCLENVLFRYRFYGTRTPEAEKDAADLLEAVGLGMYKDRYPTNLSGGMKQRLALCRVLSSDAPVIVMDEPLSALDEITRKMMQNLLIDYQSKTKCIIILITHDLDEANLLKRNTEILTLTRRS